MLVATARLLSPIASARRADPSSNPMDVNVSTAPGGGG
eukprot:CAMPEP_0197580908 /NCGR_PEP_ID=MMETSP1326-20131121/4590_2 /TAXON_ID=1155430 /ORGANISM="Genus nov. species nov., Strain RCC2288" /LENGTH=37 /DNA_ID= /DNA_START= /DNA_END= /DNA_ORIENTATION=